MARFFQIIISSVLLCTVLFSFGTSVHAEEELHEDPDTAKISFSSIALFNYYSTTLDHVLQKEPTVVEENLGKMPFANIPDDIRDPVDEFAPLMIDISYKIHVIDEQVKELETLVRQSRADEAFILAEELYGSIALASGQLASGTDNVEQTGLALKVDQSPEGGLLQLQYQAVMDKMNRIGEALKLYRDYILQLLLGLKDSELFPENMEEFLEEPEMEVEDILELLDVDIEEILEELEIPLEDLTTEDLLEILNEQLLEDLAPVDITLETEMSRYYVGETVQFHGTLSSNATPLSDRKVEIIVDGEHLATAVTGDAGSFTGSFGLPYRYVDQMEVHALYTPVGPDTETLLAGISQRILIDVLYYETILEIILEDEAYPGYETVISGTLSYQEGVIPEAERDVEIYLGDILIAETSCIDSFSETVTLEPYLKEGQHLIVISVGAEERFAPVLDTALMNVIRLTPVVEMDSPDNAMIPGSIDLTGRIYTELGPVANAKVEIRFGSYRQTIRSSSNGLIDVQAGTGFSFGLIGTQDLIVLVEPEEPYYTATRFTREVLLVNLIGCGVVLILIVLAGIFLPGRIRKGLAFTRQQRPKVFVPADEPVVQPAPVQSESRSDEGSHEEIQQEPREKILNWYVLVIRMIQRATSIFLSPQHTLREFAAEVSGNLGPLSRYFMNFTRTVERLLYSRYTPTPVDVSSSEQYYRELDSESVSEVVSKVKETGYTMPVETESEDVSLTEKPKEGLRFPQFSMEMMIVLVLAVLFFAVVLILLVSLSSTSLACGFPVVIVEEQTVREKDNDTAEGMER